MTILTSQAQVAASTSQRDLLETYNHLTGESVKRFSSVAAGQVRCTNAMLAATDRGAHAGVKKGEEPVAKPAPAASNPKPAPIAATPAPKPRLVQLESSLNAMFGEGAFKAKPVHQPAAIAPCPMTNMATSLTPKEIKLVDPVAMLKAGKCPLCGGHESSQTAAGAEGTIAGEERNLCHECGNEYWTVGLKAGSLHARRKPGRDAGSGIKKSWTDADVRAARSLKQRVKVDGVEYRSVAQAFKELKLPYEKHVKFRGGLKASLKANFVHGGKTYKFAIVG